MLDSWTIAAWRGLFGALEPPLAPLWVWIVFQETPSASTLGGGVLVVAAVVLHLFAVSRSNSRRAAA